MLILSIIYISSLITYYYSLRKYVIEEDDIKDIELSTVILALIVGIIPVINTYALFVFLFEMMKYKDDIAEKLLKKVLFIKDKDEKKKLI